MSGAGYFGPDEYEQARSEIHNHFDELVRKQESKFALAVRPEQPIIINTPAASLPALTDAESVLSYLGEVDNALAETYEIADTLKIKRRTDAIRYLTAKMGLDQSIKNRATQSQIRAQVKMGKLLAQMPKHPAGRPSNNRDDNEPDYPPSYADLEISKTDAQRYRVFAQIDPKKLEKFIQQTVEQQFELTVGRAFKYAQNVLKLGPHFSSDNDSWRTPQALLKTVIAIMDGIDLDPCSDGGAAPNVPAARHFTEADDGLAQEWGGRVFMNPPYGDALPHWIDKLVLEFLDGRTTQAIALVPARTDTTWFRELKNYPRCFLWGRVNFNDGVSPAPFPSMLVGLGCDREKFIRVLSEIGDVYEIARLDETFTCL